MNRHFPKEDMANRYTKTFLTSLIRRKIQFKTIVKYHHIHFRIASIKKKKKNQQEIISVHEDVEKGNV